MLNISRLLPSEGKFFRLLDQLTAEAGLSALHLKAFVDSRDAAQREKALAAIAHSRQTAKMISAEITRELCLTFITPFDREDIQSFALHLYKICKTTDKVSDYMQRHGVSDLSELSAQVNLIVQESEAMRQVVDALIKGGKPERVMAEAALLDTLENRGDEILGGLLVRLISETKDVRQLILKKDIYDMLERIIDKYRDAAGVALQIALKHT